MGERAHKRALCGINEEKPEGTDEQVQGLLPQETAKGRA
jgi:hypothetical protein